MDVYQKCDAEYERRREALAATLTEEAVRVFNAWLECHRDRFPDDEPITAEEIKVQMVADGQWLPFVDREEFENDGAGEAAPAEIEALLLFISWFTVDRPTDDDPAVKAASLLSHDALIEAARNSADLGCNDEE